MPFAPATSDPVVGGSNDAVKILDSSVGSRVAPRLFIMAVATLVELHFGDVEQAFPEADGIVEEHSEGP